VPTQLDIFFDESNFSINSNGSLPSAGRDGCHISIPKSTQLLCNHKLIVKLTLAALEIKISTIEKTPIGDSIFDRKKINQSHRNSAIIGFT
jgi:hypothetical protein